MLELKRQTQLEGKFEVSDLKKGMDFRLPQYRREVFVRFYEFHLQWKSHPGAVYYVIPFLAKKLNMTIEQKLWFCYINGCTQNPLTSYVIFSQFPDFGKIDFAKLEEWHAKYWRRLDYDTDRRYCKGHFVEMATNYKELLGTRTQEEFYKDLCSSDDKYKNFEKCWDFVKNNFHRFGRLSTFSYLEYIRIAGINIDCNNLFMEDIDGSKSHRNGILKVLGRDDLDWHKGLNGITTHSKEIIAFAKEEAHILFEECKERFKDKEFANDVSLFTFESTLCCYKSWFRENRRYPNVYNDMFYNRIKKAETLGWEDHGLNFDIFWEARKENLPEKLRLECNPKDPGLKASKQNHFRETGEVILMDLDWNCFENNFNKNN